MPITKYRKWSERLDDLRRYRDVHGDCNVPMGYRKEKSLAVWVNFQRQEYRKYISGRKSSMSCDRISDLESIGFEWDPLGAAWSSRLAELAAYRVEHGHCNVPRTYKKNLALARWVVRQREDRKLKMKGLSSGMTDERERELNRLGFVWLVLGTKTGAIVERREIKSDGQQSLSPKTQEQENLISFQNDCSLPPSQESHRTSKSLKEISAVAAENSTKDVKLLQMDLKEQIAAYEYFESRRNGDHSLTAVSSKISVMHHGQPREHQEMQEPTKQFLPGETVALHREQEGNDGSDMWSSGMKRLVEAHKSTQISKAGMRRSMMTGSVPVVAARSSTFRRDPYIATNQCPREMQYHHSSPAVLPLPPPPHPRRFPKVDPYLDYLTLCEHAEFPKLAYLQAQSQSRKRQLQQSQRREALKLSLQNSGLAPSAAKLILPGDLARLNSQKMTSNSLLAMSSKEKSALLDLEARRRLGHSLVLGGLLSSPVSFTSHESEVPSLESGDYLFDRAFISPQTRSLFSAESSCYQKPEELTSWVGNERKALNKAGKLGILANACEAEGIRP